MLKLGPKILPLGEDESIASLERWRQNVLYHLRINEEFRPYLNSTFGKKTKLNPTRDLEDTTEQQTLKNEEGENVRATVIIKTKEDKCFEVDTLLEQIANFAPTIPRNDIVKDSASVQEVWGKVRMYFNLEASGALANECWQVKRKPEETPQALYARLKQLYDENLLKSDGLHYVDGPLTEDEEMSPSLHNTVVLHWLNILHPQLRDAVTARFSTQLREKTYAALFPEISRCVGPLLDELNNDTTANRVFSKQSYRTQSSNQNRSNYKSSSQYVKRSCEFCKMTGKEKYYTHNMDTCLFIKREKLRGNTAVKKLECDDEEALLQEQYEEFYSQTGEVPDHDDYRVVEHVINFVDVNASPVLYLNKNSKSYRFVLDTGCTGSLVDREFAVSSGSPIKPTQQRARGPDGKLMNIIGEVNVVLHRKNKPYHLFALVCADKVDLLAGMPFLKKNDIGVRPATDEIIIDGKEFVKYDPVRRSKYNNTRQVSQFTVQSLTRQVIFPGQTGIFSVKGCNGMEEKAAIQPRWDSHCNTQTKESKLWPPPHIANIDNGKVHISNDTKEPVVIKRLEHIGNIQTEVSTEDMNEIITSKVSTNDVIEDISLKGSTDSMIKPTTSPIKTSDHSASVKVNPDKVLSSHDESRFRQLLKTYDQVFSPVTSTYNGKFGECFVEVNVGDNLPPQRKGRLPFYGRDNLQMLQQKFDDLEKVGVFSRPQDIGVTVENTNPSFLVNKPHSSKKRLVTDFASISEYCRPTPSKLPSTEETLKTIGTFKLMIPCDMSDSYFQLKLKKSSKRFCGVHTPYKGLRVYNVGCMGLPGVEVALEELTCLLLGDLVEQGIVAKLADDLFIGGNTPEELYRNFETVLSRFLAANIKLGPGKTVIAPKSITILGWIWTSGQLSASPHILTALSTCSLPDTVSSLKSFIGTYRFISRVLPRYANSLTPLEAATHGKKGNEKIDWSSDLEESFHKAQRDLSNAKTITIPIPSDTLWIVTDAAMRPSAIGATLYAVRDGKPHLSGFFNSKLPAFQSRWMPCEVEGLAVAAALNHYAPFIRDSSEKAQVLTDSKVVVQAVQKFRRGEFPTSSRLVTFLAAVSRHDAQIQHIPGSVNLPSDYASRHPLTCDNPESCQTCKFVHEMTEAVVNEVSISDFVEGKVRLPFTNRASWRVVQSECPVLRKVLHHVRNGTNPHKKSKNCKSVKRYLTPKIRPHILLASDGVLVHRMVKPLAAYDQIVIPEQVLDGLITALHLGPLEHPTTYQMKKVFSRYFYSLNSDASIKTVTDACHHCASIKEVPKSLIHQSTSDPPSSVGNNFTADIIKRCRDKIFIIRENTTSYTLAEHVPSETAKEITRILIKLCNILKPSKLSPIKVRVDPASAHKSMFIQSDELHRNNINLELGRTKNINKNAIVDKAVKELHRELLNVQPSGGPVTPLQLSEAVANLNSRIRFSGMSAFELWTQRDQASGDQLPLNDRELIMQQYKQRLSNHASSERSKAGNKPPHPSPKVAVGSLVYIHNDRDKTEARKRYMVTEITDTGYKLRKFTASLFSKAVYDVKPSEIYVVPEYYKHPLPEIEDSSDDEVYEDCSESHQAHDINTDDSQDSDDSVESAPDSSIHDSESSTSSQEESQEVSSDEGGVGDPHLPVPPAELTQPVNNRRRSLALKQRLRNQPPVNYKD